MKMALSSHAELTSNYTNGSGFSFGGMNGTATTINPQALSNGGGSPSSNDRSPPRGIKRSHSPDETGVQADSNDLKQARKKGKLGRIKNERITPSPGASSCAPAVQPVILATQGLPPAKPKVTLTIKALPTVRDHTSDQLNAARDEYTAREYDGEGERKIDDMGYLQGGRQYKIRTFQLPGRGNKLFMLATECARCLQYRDSYLLFNKNRSLYKLIALPKDKEDLVAHDILPYSYRSRQIALVAARSMFRQFGSRVIKDGRRVRDDYWEAKAKKQGFTEADAAGEKRPGAARNRELAQAHALSQRQLLQATNSGIIYDSNPVYQPPTMPPAALAIMYDPAYYADYDAKFHDIIRPRQDLPAPIYNDLTRSSSEAEMASQSNHAAEFSKSVNSQGQFRNGIVSAYWKRPHDPPVTTPPIVSTDLPPTTRHSSSPHFEPSDIGTSGPISQPGRHLMNPPSFPHQQPVRSPSRSTSMSEQMTQMTPSHRNFTRAPSNLSISESAPSFNDYSNVSQHATQQLQSWGQPPPQPTPSPSMNSRMYNNSQAHSSPHLQPGQVLSPSSQHSPVHPPEMQTPQLFRQGMPSMTMNPQQMYMANANMAGMAGNNFNPAMMAAQQNMYSQLNSSQQFQQMQNLNMINQMQQPGQHNFMQSGHAWTQGFQ